MSVNATSTCLKYLLIAVMLSLGLLSTSVLGQIHMAEESGHCGHFCHAVKAKIEPHAAGGHGMVLCREVFLVSESSAASQVISHGAVLC